MTLFEAEPYDPAKARKRRMQIISVIVGLIVLGLVAWYFRHWREEHQVDKFFDALQQQNYEQAYGVWMNDPDWKQHPQNFKRYPFTPNFMTDWGPGSEWGIIKSHHIDGTAVPSGGNANPFVRASGVVVVVTVNDRVADKAHIWVEKSDNTLNLSPY
jgi:hypothetical protein